MADINKTAQEEQNIINLDNQNNPNNQNNETSNIFGAEESTCPNTDTINKIDAYVTDIDKGVYNINAQLTQNVSLGAETIKSKLNDIHSQLLDAGPNGSPTLKDKINSMYYGESGSSNSSDIIEKLENGNIITSAYLSRTIGSTHVPYLDIISNGLTYTYFVDDKLNQISYLSILNDSLTYTYLVGETYTHTPYLKQLSYNINYAAYNFSQELSHITEAINTVSGVMYNEAGFCRVTSEEELNDILAAHKHSNGIYHKPLYTKGYTISPRVKTTETATAAPTEASTESNNKIYPELDPLYNSDYTYITYFTRVTDYGEVKWGETDYYTYNYNILYSELENINTSIINSNNIGRDVYIECTDISLLEELCAYAEKFDDSNKNLFKPRCELYTRKKWETTEDYNSFLPEHTDEFKPEEENVEKYIYKKLKLSDYKNLKQTILTQRYYIKATNGFAYIANSVSTEIANSNYVLPSKYVKFDDFTTLYRIRKHAQEAVKNNTDLQVEHILYRQAEIKSENIGASATAVGASKVEEIDDADSAYLYKSAQYDPDKDNFVYTYYVPLTLTEYTEIDFSKDYYINAKDKTAYITNVLHSISENIVDSLSNFKTVDVKEAQPSELYNTYILAREAKTNNYIFIPDNIFYYVKDTINLRTEEFDDLNNNTTKPSGPSTSTTEAPGGAIKVPADTEDKKSGVFAAGTTSKDDDEDKLQVVLKEDDKLIDNYSEVKDYTTLDLTGETKYYYIVNNEVTTNLTYLVDYNYGTENYKLVTNWKDLRYTYIMACTGLTDNLPEVYYYDEYNNDFIKINKDYYNNPQLLNYRYYTYVYDSASYDYIADTENPNITRYYIVRKNLQNEYMSELSNNSYIYNYRYKANEEIAKENNALISKIVDNLQTHTSSTDVTTLTDALIDLSYEYKSANTTASQLKNPTYIATSAIKDNINNLSTIIQNKDTINITQSVGLSEPLEKRIPTQYNTNIETKYKDAHYTNTINTIVKFAYNNCKDSSKTYQDYLEEAKQLYNGVFCPDSATYINGKYYAAICARVTNGEASTYEYFIPKFNGHANEDSDNISWEEITDLETLSELSNTELEWSNIPEDAKFITQSTYNIENDTTYLSYTVLETDNNFIISNDIKTSYTYVTKYLQDNQLENICSPYKADIIPLYEGIGYNYVSSFNFTYSFKNAYVEIPCNSPDINIYNTYFTYIRTASDFTYKACKFEIPAEYNPQYYINVKYNIYEPVTKDIQYNYAYAKVIQRGNTTYNTLSEISPIFNNLIHEEYKSKYTWNNTNPKDTEHFYGYYMEEDGKLKYGDCGRNDNIFTYTEHIGVKYDTKYPTKIIPITYTFTSSYNNTNTTQQLYIDNKNNTEKNPLKCNTIILDNINTAVNVDNFTKCHITASTGAGDVIVDTYAPIIISTEDYTYNNTPYIKVTYITTETVNLVFYNGLTLNKPQDTYKQIKEAALYIEDDNGEILAVKPVICKYAPIVRYYNGNVKLSRGSYIMYKYDSTYNKYVMMQNGVDIDRNNTPIYYIQNWSQLYPVVTKVENTNKKEATDPDFIDLITDIRTLGNIHNENGTRNLDAWSASKAGGTYAYIPINPILNFAGRDIKNSKDIIDSQYIKYFYRPQDYNYRYPFINENADVITTNIYWQIASRQINDFRDEAYPPLITSGTVKQNILATNKKVLAKKYFYSKSNEILSNLDLTNNTIYGGGLVEYPETRPIFTIGKDCFGFSNIYKRNGNLTNGFSCDTAHNGKELNSDDELYLTWTSVLGDIVEKFDINSLTTDINSKNRIKVNEYSPEAGYDLKDSLYYTVIAITEVIPFGALRTCAPNDLTIIEPEHIEIEGHSYSVPFVIGNNKKYEYTGTYEYIAPEFTYVITDKQQYMVNVNLSDNGILQGLNLYSYISDADVLYDYTYDTYYTYYTNINDYSYVITDDYNDGLNKDIITRTEATYYKVYNVRDKNDLIDLVDVFTYYLKPYIYYTQEKYIDKDNTVTSFEDITNNYTYKAVLSEFLNDYYKGLLLYVDPYSIVDSDFSSIERYGVLSSTYIKPLTSIESTDTKYLTKYEYIFSYVSSNVNANSFDWASLKISYFDDEEKLFNNIYDNELNYKKYKNNFESLINYYNTYSGVFIDKQAFNWKFKYSKENNTYIPLYEKVSKSLRFNIESFIYQDDNEIDIAYELFNTNSFYSYEYISFTEFKSNMLGLSTSMITDSPEYEQIDADYTEISVQSDDNDNLYNAQYYNSYVSDIEYIEENTGIYGGALIGGDKIAIGENTNTAGSSPNKTIVSGITNSDGSKYSIGGKDAPPISLISNSSDLYVVNKFTELDNKLAEYKAVDGYQPVKFTYLFTTELVENTNSEEDETENNPIEKSSLYNLNNYALHNLQNNKIYVLDINNEIFTKLYNVSESIDNAGIVVKIFNNDTNSLLFSKTFYINSEKYIDKLELQNSNVKNGDVVSIHINNNDDLIKTSTQSDFIYYDYNYVSVFSNSDFVASAALQGFTPVTADNVKLPSSPTENNTKAPTENNTKAPIEDTPVEGSSEYNIYIENNLVLNSAKIYIVNAIHDLDIQIYLTDEDDNNLTVLDSISNGYDYLQYNNQYTSNKKYYTLSEANNYLAVGDIDDLTHPELLQYSSVQAVKPTYKYTEVSYVTISQICLANTEQKNSLDILYIDKDDELHKYITTSYITYSIDINNEDFSHIFNAQEIDSKININNEYVGTYLYSCVYFLDLDNPDSDWNKTENRTKYWMIANYDTYKPFKLYNPANASNIKEWTENNFNQILYFEYSTTYNTLVPHPVTIIDDTQEGAWKDIYDGNIAYLKYTYCHTYTETTSNEYFNPICKFTNESQYYEKYNNSYVPYDSTKLRSWNGVPSLYIREESFGDYYVEYKNRYIKVSNIDDEVRKDIKKYYIDNPYTLTSIPVTVTRSYDFIYTQTAKEYYKPEFNESIEPLITLSYTYNSNPVVISDAALHQGTAIDPIIAIHHPGITYTALTYSMAEYKEWIYIDENYQEHIYEDKVIWSKEDNAYVGIVDNNKVLLTGIIKYDNHYQVEYKEYQAEHYTYQTAYKKDAFELANAKDLIYGNTATYIEPVKDTILIWNIAKENYEVKEIVVQDGYYSYSYNYVDRPFLTHSYEWIENPVTIANFNELTYEMQTDTTYISSYIFNINNTLKKANDINNNQTYVLSEVIAGLDYDLSVNNTYNTNVLKTATNNLTYNVSNRIDDLSYSLTYTLSYTSYDSSRHIAYEISKLDKDRYAYLLKISNSIDKSAKSIKSAMHTQGTRIKTGIINSAYIVSKSVKEASNNINNALKPSNKSASDYTNVTQLTYTVNSMEYYITDNLSSYSKTTYGDAHQNSVNTLSDMINDIFTDDITRTYTYTGNDGHKYKVEEHKIKNIVNVLNEIKNTIDGTDTKNFMIGKIADMYINQNFEPYLYGATYTYVTPTSIARKCIVRIKTLWEEMRRAGLIN